MQAPVPFDLELTVRSHGWYDLPPWRYDSARRVLGRPLLLRPGRAVHAEVAEGGAPGGLAVRLAAEGRLSAVEARAARAQLSACLGLDEDLAPFYRTIEELERSEGQDLPRLGWARRRGAGRLLRSPTVFEDAVKTLCTTNCAWSLTRVMVSNLVERLGEPAPHGTRAFPTPEAMARRPEEFYRKALDLEIWRGSRLPTAELAERIRALRGFGPYATEHLLRLLGRHEHLALDSWNRKKLARLRGRRRPPSDRALRRRYAPYGEWAGLAMWLEATADWHGDRSTWP
jgi:3-methyladenine DNA glycosylase/8-oxoguanine DNA glycosylase